MNPALIEELKNSEIFSLLGEQKSSQLIEKMEVVDLKPGEILYEKGSVCDCMYILVQGLLVAMIRNKVGEKILGTIRSGQTVGEAGVISGQPRGATIKALRHSTLLKLSKEIFNAYFIDEPKVLLKLLDFLVTKSLRTVHVLENVNPYINIAFIAANSAVNFEEFFSKFINIFQKNKKIKCFDTRDYANTKGHLAKILDEAEKTYDYIFYKITNENIPVAEVFLERTDRIFIVADGTKPMDISPYVDNFLQQNAIKQELIILYPIKTNPAHISAWLKSFDFFRYHHIAMNDSEDCSRLMRFITGKALGLVLSGGGTKGWLHAGALKVLSEADISIDAIGGTSIGVIIAAKYMQENDYDSFFRGMKEYARVSEKPYSILNFTYPIVSVLSGRKATTATQKLFGEELIENLWKPFFCISANISQSVETVHRQGPLWLWTRASSTLPGLAPPIEVGGKMYVDGSVVNNLPVDIMKDFFDGMGKIIAIDLSSHDDKTNYHFPPIINFLDAFKIKLKLKLFKNYKFPSFHEILVRSLFMGSAKRSHENDFLADVLIKPDLSDYRLVNERSQELFEIGYSAMQEKLESVKQLINS